MFFPVLGLTISVIAFVRGFLILVETLVRPPLKVEYTSENNFKIPYQ